MVTHAGPNRGAGCEQPPATRASRERIGATEQASAKSKTDASLPDEGPSGAVPEANTPGHRPERDQDKPEPDEAAEAFGIKPANE